MLSQCVPSHFLSVIFFKEIPLLLITWYQALCRLVMMSSNVFSDSFLVNVLSHVLSFNTFSIIMVNFIFVWHCIWLVINHIWCQALFSSVYVLKPYILNEIFKKKKKIQIKAFLSLVFMLCHWFQKWNAIKDICFNVLCSKPTQCIAPMSWGTLKCQV